MDYVQINIDFDKSPSKEVSFVAAMEKAIETHVRENNFESEQVLYNNKNHFNDKCKQLYMLLMSGKRLTVYSALVEYKIASLPRRFLDLTQSGVMAKAETMVGTRIKEYWMSESDIKYNREKFKC